MVSVTCNVSSFLIHLLLNYFIYLSFHTLWNHFNSGNHWPSFVVQRVMHSCLPFLSTAIKTVYIFISVKKQCKENENDALLQLLYRQYFYYIL